MEDLIGMGFSEDLATQALAATGSKSILKATEWILNQYRGENQGGLLGAVGASSRQQQQARVDHFFAGNTVKEHEAVAPPERSLHFHRPEAALKKCEQDESGNAEALEKTQKQEERQRPNVSDNASMFLGRAPPLEALAKQPKPADLRGKNADLRAKNLTPLAERMRPITVDDVLGQDHLLGQRGLLRTLIETQKVSSMIFWGPPGTGKTSLARAISRAVSCRFVGLSAVSSGLKEVRQILEEATRAKKHGKQTLLFLDEVHRFNKAQQDAFLPFVEAGDVIFVGATTENPSFEVNSALLSRCKVLVLNKLQPEHLVELIERASLDKDKGLLASLPTVPAFESFRIEDEAIRFLAAAADGDARVALNTLELAGLIAVSRYKKKVEEDNPCGSFHMKKEPVAADRSMLGIGTKRESTLSVLESLKENVQHSHGEYTRPFKKFVGGKEIIASCLTGRDRELKSPLHAEKEITKEAKEKDPGQSPSDSCFIKGGSRTLRYESFCDKYNLRFDAFGTPNPNRDFENSTVLVTISDVQEALQRSHVLYDKSGEEHYNIISALHKSMRGGDANAGLYWLARMIEGGEDPLYVARRLVRFASEDVGLADPNALVQAVACFQACQFIGLPECNVHLAQCVVYLALAPKSIAVYQAIGDAQKCVRQTGQNEPVPLHLRNAPTSLMKDLGYGKGYIYPPGHAGPLNQEYMPASLIGRVFFEWPEAN